MVGWSFATAEAKTEAPMRSPAPTTRALLGSTPGVDFSSFLTVPAHLTVLASMRPWKSLMPTRLMVTSGAACAGAVVPTTVASVPVSRLAEATRASRVLERCRTGSTFRSGWSVRSVVGGEDRGYPPATARTQGPMLPDGEKFVAIGPGTPTARPRRSGDGPSIVTLGRDATG